MALLERERTFSFEPILSLTLSMDRLCLFGVHTTLDRTFSLDRILCLTPPSLLGMASHCGSGCRQIEAN